MRRFFTLVSLLALILLAGDAFSQEEILYLSGVEPIFSISSPNTWKTSKKSDVLTFQSKDKGQQCWIAQTDLDKPEQGVEKASDFAKKYLTTFDVKKSETFLKNKINFYKVVGTGKLNGKAGNVTILFFRTSKRAKEKVISMVYFAPTSLPEQQDASFKEIVSSIYPR